ncbi:MAG: phage portal protein, partial [Anaeroplasmataceae bacterium]|nr:phage portal protein [Anaeroplasmataceae bacterium]
MYKGGEKVIFDKLFKNSKGEFVNIMDVLFGKEELTNYIYTLAEAHAIDLIAKTIAKCEIQTFEMKDGKVQENKGDLYWTLNVQPNYNENGTKFIYKLVTKLLTDKTALVVIHEKSKSNLLYVADNYNVSNGLLHGKIFTNVEISDDEGNSLRLKKTYQQDNCIYFSLKNENLETASESFKMNMEKVLKATQKSFIRANTAKWRLKNPGGQPTMLDIETKQPISYEDYKKKITEGVFSEEEAIVLLSEMFDLINLNADNKKDLNDFEKCINQIGSFVAQKWNIPLDVFFGNKTEKSTGTQDLITFAVDTYFEIIADGLNVGLVGKEDFLKGEYVAFNGTNITHKDVLDCGTGIDKLTANRFSRNEINKLLRLPVI